MPSPRAWFVCTCLLSFAACDEKPAETNEAKPAQVSQPEPPAPTKIEPPPQPTNVEPPAPAPAEPLSFTFGARAFTAATALSSRFNDQRRIVISSMATTCDELLAIPETYKKGNVNFIVTTPWTVGTHLVKSAEILDDDTRQITNLYPETGTIEIVTAPQAVGEKGKIVLSATAAEGGAKGTIEVVLCE
jgi:hypothetical protein